jgi:DUF1680 family protein
MIINSFGSNKIKMKRKEMEFRKTIISLAVAFLAMTLVECGTKNTASEKVAYNHLTRLPLGNVTAEGWLKKQLERNKAGMGGHLDELEPEMIAQPYINRNHKSQVSPGWSGEISATFWTGFVQLAFTLNDEELKAKAGKWVYGTLALQEEDGYLGSYRKTEDRLEDYSAWSANWCYRALLHYYDATGDKKILDAVHRGLLWFVKNWAGDQKTSYAGPTLMESMIVVYMKTGDEKLYNWCLDYIKWLDAHDKFHQGMASLQRDSLEYNEDHVVAFGENVKHPALIYMAGGGEEYLDASINGLKQIMVKCWQPNGAPASNFEYLSPPSAIHVTEYCNFSTFLNTFSWMACITGKAQYGDLMERILFNGAEGARKKDERAIAYMSSPNQLYATMESCQFGLNSFEVYSPCYQVGCCPTQSVRIIPEYIRAMFLRDKQENLFIPAYGPCRVNFISGEGTNIAIFEDTNYPFDGTITFHIKASSPWKKLLMLKMPVWCKAHEIKLNGIPVTASVNADGYLPVENTWNEDTLALSFGMEPAVVTVNDIYFQKEPLRAIECGPLLFALRYPASWTPVAGTPLTPLPKDWSWYEASVLDKEKPAPPAFYSLNLTELKKGSVIVKKQSVSEYPWDDSPLKLEVPMHRSKQAYTRNWNNQRNTPLAYGNPVTADSTTEIIEMVPYGCTNLRMSCFTICK